MRTIIIAAVILAIATPALARTKSDGTARAAQTERMKACGAEWKTAKADSAVKGAGWPAYWSACNKRMKGTAAPNEVPAQQTSSGANS